MDGILEYFEKEYPELHIRDVIECSEPMSLNDLSKEYHKKQLLLCGVVKSLPSKNALTVIAFNEARKLKLKNDKTDLKAYAFGFIDGSELMRKEINK